MNINWKVRLKNKYFWLTLIPAVLVGVKQLLALFGVAFDIGTLESRLIDLVGTVFSILGVLGIVVDPTTEGVSDSAQALTYDAPKGGDAEETNE